MELIKKDPNAIQPWPVIPFARIKKVWEDYMRLGFVRDEKGINQMVETIIHNIHRLAANTYLMGHTSSDPSEDFKEAGITTEEQLNAFYDYAIAENGQLRLSDYGLEPLQKEAINLEKTYDATERLQIIDRIFNIVHRRSDLSAMFIEGGSSSLDQLFGDKDKVDNKNEYANEYASAFNLHRYLK